MKGLSPLIAAVLLIAFTVAISSIFMGWMSETSRETTKKVSDNLETSAQASSASVSIESLIEYGGNYTLMVSNSGYKDFNNVTGTVLFTDGSTCNFNNIPISKGDVGILTASGCKDIVTNTEISKVVVATDLGGISDSITGSDSTYINADYENNFLKGLVLHYDFSDGSGSTVYDKSVNSNDGTLKNFADTTAGAGDTGDSGWLSDGGLKFDGVDDYVATSTLIEISDNWTVSTQIKWNGTSKYYNFYCGFKATFDGFGLKHAGTYEPFFRDGDGNYKYFDFDTTNLIDTDATLTWVMDNGELSLYINGEYINTYSVIPSDLTFNCFGFGYANDYSFNGKFYNAKIYSEPLTADEITYLYRRGL